MQIFFWHASNNWMMSMYNGVAKTLDQGVKHLIDTEAVKINFE